MSAPGVVMFIRHGEKPDDPGPPHGINRHGERDPHSLSVRGWTRAGALAAMLARVPAAWHPQLAVPERIIATKATHDYASKREVATAQPLARRLGIGIDERFGHRDVEAVAGSILGDSRPTLVVWHHGSMADLLARLPIGNAAEVPRRWPDDRFDLIWVLTRGSQDESYRFTSVAQELLEGDAPA